MRWIVMFICIHFLGCSLTSEKQAEFAIRKENRLLNSLFQEFYLSPLPQWANFSSAGKCFRKQQITFLNLKKLMSSFSFDYFEAIDVQRQLNRALLQLPGGKLEQILLADQHQQLADAIERVKAENYSLLPPESKRVNLIWIDSLIQQSSLEKLSSLLQKEFFYSGYPILFSFCMTSIEFEKILQDNLIDDFAGSFIGAESLSIYSEQGDVQPLFWLNVNKLLNGQYDIYIYLKEGEQIPLGIKGEFKAIKHFVL